MKPHLLAASASALLAASLAACGGSDPAPTAASITGPATPTLAQPIQQPPAAAPTPPAAQPAQTAAAPPASAAASLKFMREEEQLAHDVYVAAAARYALPIFANIAGSETSHVSAVAALLSRYGLPDPMAGLPTGTFATPEFQALYDTLVASSAVSLVDALKVGAEIEELDIRDIEAQKSGIDDTEILSVYDQLLRGSRNHLRAFVQVLGQQGGHYAPKYIPPAVFDSIVNSPTETGR